jgi:hypothetical protein
MSSGYNPEAVNREIRRDPRIGAEEARLIHALLRGRDPVSHPTVADAMSGEKREHEDQTSRKGRNS